jgi:hypothetical protein
MMNTFAACVKQDNADLRRLLTTLRVKGPQRTFDITRMQRRMLRYAEQHDYAVYGGDTWKLTEVGCRWLEKNQSQS